MRKVIAGTLVGYGLAFAAMSAHSFSWASVLQFLSSLGNEASALAITTKQTALAAFQESLAAVNANKQLATAMGVIQMSDRLINVFADFNPETGQPDATKCEAQKNTTLHVEAESQKQKDAAHLMQTFAAGRVSTRAAGEVETLAVHRDAYCTVSEAKQGMCTLSANGMQGWDSNYAGAFGEVTLAPEGELAAYAYAGMLADARAEAVIDCKSAACVAASVQQLGSAAASAMAANAIIGQVTDRRVPMMTGK